MEFKAIIDAKARNDAGCAVVGVYEEGDLGIGAAIALAFVVACVAHIRGIVGQLLDRVERMLRAQRRITCGRIAAPYGAMAGDAGRNPKQHHADSGNRLHWS